MATDVLKEFLVSLGFSVDDKSAKKAKEGMAKVEESVRGLAIAASAAAAAVAASVVKMSSDFEDLYYASQRIGDTVDRIKGLNYAISQVGGTAKGSMQALENVAEFMRSNPGGERFIQGLGVATRDANGQMRGMTDIVADLGDQFRKMPYAMAKPRAQIIGIDPITLQALIRGTGDFRKRYSDMARQIGVDQQEAAKKTRDFMRSIRDLQAQADLFIGKFLLAFDGPAGDALKRFGDVALRVLSGAAILLGRVAEGFGALDKATDGWASILLIALAVLTPILAILGPVVAGVVALGAAVVALTDDFLTWKAGGESLIDWSKWSDEIDSAVAGFQDLMDAANELWNALKPFMTWLSGVLVPFLGGAFTTTLSGITTVLRGLADVITVITDLLQGKWVKAWEDAGKAVTNAKGGIKDVLGKGAAWIGNTVKAAMGDTSLSNRDVQERNDERAKSIAAAKGSIGVAGKSATELGKQALAYFRSQGWTREQAAGIVANLAQESSFNAKAVGDGGHAYGVAQWHEDRQAAFKKWSGKDIRQSTFAEQLAFVQHELTQGLDSGARRAGTLLRNTKSAYEAGGIVSRHYERPGSTDAIRAMEARNRGAMAQNWFARSDLVPEGAKPAQVTIQQQTDIHVQGGNAHDTGRAVANEQQRVNGNLIRHTQSVVR